MIRLTFEAETSAEVRRLVRAWLREEAHHVAPRPSPRPILQPEAAAALAAAVNGLTSRQLADILGVPSSSLPPIVAGWHRRARARGMSLEAMLAVTSAPVGGRPASRYRLTEAGRAVLAPGRAED
jgi:hypothetical protein